MYDAQVSAVRSQHVFDLRFNTTPKTINPLIQ